MGLPVARVRDETVEALRASRDTALLRVMYLDLIAEGRYPSPFDDHDYSDLSDARASLSEHLRAIGAELDGASMRELNDLREQLVNFSGLLGDRAFLGIYPDELRPAEADAGGGPSLRVSAVTRDC